MSDSNVITLIMAAGKGTRMKSQSSKLVQKIYDKELIKRVVELAEKIGSNEIVAIVGHMQDQIREVLGDRVEYAVQEELLGTGHAIMQAEKFLKGKKGKVVILSGDVPLIRPDTINKLIEQNSKNKEYATILTAEYSNPTGYGRIIRNAKGSVDGIVEEKDASATQKLIKEINSGIYCFDIEELLKALKKINNNNAQGEYYLTDVIEIMHNKDLKIGAMVIDDNMEILGINDRIQLELVTRVLRNRINSAHMRAGVTIEDINTTYIYDDVVIGQDTVIHPNTTIKGDVVIGANCEIGPNAYIREGTRIADNVKVGNFVELKKAIIDSGTKVPHFIYLGDCEVGKNTNIGCGTITCNYDGVNKHKTLIGDNCFIGSNVNFVAPVKIGNNSKIAAGSTITEDVPEDTLAFGRARQVNKDGYNKKK